MTHRTRITTSLTVAMGLVLGQACGRGETHEKSSLPPLPAGEVAGTVIGAVNMGDAGTDGPVIESRAGASRPAEQGKEVRANDLVSAGSKGGIMMELGGTDRVALNSGTVVKVESGTAIELEKGEIWVEDAMAEKAGRLEVSAGETKVKMDGAHGSVRVDEKGTSVSLVSGSAQIVRAGTTTSVVAGQEISMDGGGRVVMRPLGDAGDLVAWTDRLRAEIRSRATGDVPAAPAGGIGTMAARAPGSANLLPFELVAQDVQVRIQDRVAVTVIEQSFKNPTSTTVEGLYRFPVPAGAHLNRYDMEIKGKLMQGEIVERQRGRVIMKQVIDEFLYVMRDPALVEWESGSTFKTRIFPIGPKETKRILLSYVQLLDGDAGRYRYVLPVSAGGADAPAIPDFRVSAEVSGAQGMPLVHTPLYESATAEKDRTATVEFAAKDFRPPVDFVIELEPQGGAASTMVTYGKGHADATDEALFGKLDKASKEEAGWEWFFMDLSPEVPVTGEDLTGRADWVLVVDTSQSRTPLDMQVQRNLVAAMVGSFARNDRVKVVAYDVTARAMTDSWAEPGGSLTTEIDAFLSGIEPAGATDLLAAIEEAVRQAQGSENPRIVLVGDGAATLGERRAGRLAERAGTVAGSIPVTTIGVGSSVDSLLLAEISRRTSGKFFAVSAGEDLLRAAVRVIATMRLPVLEDVRFSFEGLEVKDVSPASLPNLGVGEQVTVAGRYRGTGSLEVKMTGTIAGRDFTTEAAFDVGPGKAGNSFVPLVWAARRIDDLTLAGDEESIEEVVALSKRYSLPSRWTSFIVLENDAMYKEFGVKQTDDRLDWAGDAIDYEAGQMPEDDDAALDDESMASVATSGKGGGGLGGAAVMAKSPPPAKMASEAKKAAPGEASELGGGFDSYDISFDPGYYRSYCTPSTVVTITELPPPTGDAAVAKKLESLQEDVQDDPLHRLFRKRLVDYLVRVGRVTEAKAEVEKWRALDTADPTVLAYVGDLDRLSGDPDSALRHYSGALDMDPERRAVLESLALWMESQERWDVAFALRLSLHQLKTSDRPAIVRLAVAAARAGRTEDAQEAALMLLEKTADDRLVPAKGVKLKADERALLERLASGDGLPLGHGAPSLSASASAKVKVELTWKGDADLDLWVASGGKFAGGDSKGGCLMDGKTGSAGEVFYMPKLEKGKLVVQVSCASGSCGNVAGKLVIKADDKKKTIPFVMEEGQGATLGEIRVTRHNVKCAYR